LFRTPLVQRGYSALVNLRFARTLSLLLGGGVSLVDGVILAGRATGSAWVARLAESGAEALRHGKNLAEAVRAIEPLSASLPGWIQAGEASGKLENLLENAGDRYQQQWDRLISRGLSVLEPLLILAVGLFVLLIALSILLPVMSLNQAMI
jgi:type II secretory pathway component PulF